MGARVWSAFGWAGLTALGAGMVLLYPRYVDLVEDVLSAAAEPAPFLWWAMVLGIVAVGTVVARALVPEEDEPERWRVRTALAIRAAACALGAWLLWSALPVRYLRTTVEDGHQRLPVEQMVEVWTAAAVVVLGLLLSVFAGRRLTVRPWLGIAAGVPAGALAVVLVWQFAPAVVRPATLEHTTAAAGPVAAVPETVTRVGWTWESPYPVTEVTAGARGPVVHHEDGFTGLDGATGEELWTYRLPYGRDMETGTFAGVAGRVHLSHRPDPATEARALVVLDTATGEVLHDASVPEPDPEYPIRGGHLGVDVRVRALHDERGSVVVGYPLDSDEPLWERLLGVGGAGRTCLWGPGGGVRVYADRVLVNRMCLDSEDLTDNPEQPIPDLPPQGTVQSVIALDAATGEEVWRHEAESDPEDQGYRFDTDPPETGGAPLNEGADPVVLAFGAAFGMSTGERVPVLPEGEWDTDHPWTRADTGGAVVPRRTDGGDMVEVVRTGADGEIVQRTEVDRTLLEYHRDREAIPLARALVASVIRHPDGDRATFQVASVPWDGMEGRGEPTWIAFEGETGGDPASTPALFAEEQSHELFTAPGAVVVHLPGRNTVHGLVP